MCRRDRQDVVREAEALIRSGVKEICLIAQDITYYGMDKWTDARPNRRSAVDSSRGESLASLLRALHAIEGDFWIRLLYTHTAHWSDELTAAIAECPKVARYVDTVSYTHLQFTIRSTPGGIEALHCTQQTLQVNTKFG